MNKLLLFIILFFILLFLLNNKERFIIGGQSSEEQPSEEQPSEERRWLSCRGPEGDEQPLDSIGTAPPPPIHYAVTCNPLPSDSKWDAERRTAGQQAHGGYTCERLGDPPRGAAETRGGSQDLEWCGAYTHPDECYWETGAGVGGGGGKCLAINPAKVSQCAAVSPSLIAALAGAIHLI